MSFLLNRASSAFGGGSHSSATGSSGGGEALFDADDDEMGESSRRGHRSASRYARPQEDDGDDDELEAAFGDTGASARHVRSGTGNDSHLDDGDEAERLLEEGSSFERQPVASGSGSAAVSRHHYSRTNSTTTLGNLSTVSAGGYDFEADPYDRRSAAIASTSDLQPATSASGSNRRRRGRNGNNGSVSHTTGGGGFLALIRDNLPLPARLRQYGLLNGNSTANNGRRRADGTTDADDDDDVESLAYDRLALQRRVMVRWAPKEALTMSEPGTISIVLSECSEMLSMPER